MNEQGQPDGRKKKGPEAQQKGETERVVLSSLVAFNFPFPTVKMSETGNFSTTELKEKEKEAKSLEAASHRQGYTQHRQ